MESESERAFLRLQELIIAKSPDESIFAWILDPAEDHDADKRHEPYIYSGLLAPSTRCFALSGDVACVGRSHGFHLTPSGLSVDHVARPCDLGAFEARLDASRSAHSDRYAIALVRFAGRGFYSRRHTASVSAPEKIGLPQHLNPAFWLRNTKFDKPPAIWFIVLRRTKLGIDDRVTLPDEKPGTVGIIKIYLTRWDVAWVRLGFNWEGRPALSLEYNDHKLDNYYEALERQQGNSEAEITHHPVFNDGWIQSPGMTRLSGIRYEIFKFSQANSDSPRHDARLRTEKSTLIVSFVQVPDLNPTSAAMNGIVWAVDISLDHGFHAYRSIESATARSSSPDFYTNCCS
ncbi:hypothetical protein F5Y16DRAFT_406598 [Xylariaceae sp. FL0255]|nr:hypothetical protein F5Y16DRAFT_406598 [Xylariaceae sp. FL0255]